MANSYTANYNLTKPEVGGDSNAWGAHINSDLDVIDTTMKSGQDAAAAAQATANGAVTTANNAMAQANAAQTIANGALSKYGVTDGSDASAGQIGEYLTGAISGTVSAQAQVGTLNLTAGDWDVWCGAQLTVSGTATLTGLSLSATGSPPSGQPGRVRVQNAGANLAGANIDLNVSPIRVLTAGPITVAAYAVCNGSSASVSGIIQARRVR